MPQCLLSVFSESYRAGGQSFRMKTIVPETASPFKNIPYPEAADAASESSVLQNRTGRAKTVFSGGTFSCPETASTLRPYARGCAPF